MKTNWNTAGNAESQDSDALDHILASDDRLAPSSGFAASVMDAIATEEAAPPPLAFPWKRAIPGFAAIGAALFAILRLATQAASSSQTVVSPANTQAIQQWLSSPALRSAGPLVLALFAAYLGLWMAKKMAGESAGS